MEDFIQNYIFLKSGFQVSDFQKAELENSYLHPVRPDLILEKNGRHFLIEIKYYRNFFSSSDNIELLLQYMNRVKNACTVPYDEYIVIMLCSVEDSVIQDIHDKHGITLWDIRNVVYLCQNDAFARKKLEELLPFPLENVQPCLPLGWSEEEFSSVSETPPDDMAENLIAELQACECGRQDNQDKKYEKICTDILKYLFSSEFYRIQEQHSTKDDLFRMDLLCSLKGTTEFWKFLIHFYHTKFVVFEYKNYTEPISQNLIYITEKYLYHAALRNAAFIISRKGFHENAEKAAEGCLKENGKLIISLTDEDLIKMLIMKKNGEEASDYLLEKTENLLMSVSK